MSKPRQEINPQSGKNLKNFCKEQGITQARLAEQIEVTPNTLSKICKGKAPLTSRIADAIVKCYPSVRREWLKGEDEYKSQTEKSLAELSSFSAEWQQRLSAVKVLALLSGYEISLFKEEDNKLNIEDALNSVKEGYKICKDGHILAICPLERFNLLSIDCQELVEQRIKSYVREVSDNG